MDDLAADAWEVFRHGAGDGAFLVEVPPGHAADAKEYCMGQHARLLITASLLGGGHVEMAASLRERALRYERIATAIRDIGLPSEHAMRISYRTPPRDWTQVASPSSWCHRTGVKVAQQALLIGAAVSLISNCKCVAIDKSKTLAQGAADLLKDTAMAGAVGYAGGFLGTVLKAVMRQSSNGALKGASRTLLPAMLVTIAIESGVLFKSYLNGDMDGTAFLHSVGEKGAMFWSSVAVGGICQTLIPVPVLGAILGGLLGSVLSSRLYSGCLALLRETREAKDREAQYHELNDRCEELRTRLESYSQDSDRLFSEHFGSLSRSLWGLLDEIEAGLVADDLDALAASAVRLAETLGSPMEINDFEEHLSFLYSGKTLVL
ncbi:MAG: hypothetical protein LBR80_08640 [Deltaproteobacteria bacterium]|jgi:hypothetical protein|nr:hypothetical protein [Deltaproteobacteria bacterium]